MPPSPDQDFRLFVDPLSPLHPTLTAALEENGLADLGPAILRVAREAVRIESTVPDDYSLSGCSRFGGFPDLPDAVSFPKSDDGRYWIFLAQLNLAELAGLNSYLPRSGLLSFFADSTETLNARVLYYAGDFQALKTVRHEGGDEMIWPGGDYTESPHRVEFRPYVSLPHEAPAGIEGEDADDAYETCRHFLEAGGHRLNGYPDTEFESPQEQAADALGGQPGEWVPLLRLEWDGNVGFCFADAGILTFCIHQEDLRKADFSRVHLILEC